MSDDWQVDVPSWRRDVDGPADLVEEVIRIVGIDDVPPVPLPREPGVARPTATPEQKLERRVRRAAAARGPGRSGDLELSCRSVRPSLFGGGAWTPRQPDQRGYEGDAPVAAARPVVGGGAEPEARRERGAAVRDRARYLADADHKSDERPTLAAVLAGERGARGWRDGKAASFDAFDAKAEALALLAAAGAPVENLQVLGEAGEAWHPGQSGTLRLGPKNVLATFGMLHPSLTRAFDLDGAVAAVELYLDALPAKRASGFMRPPYAPPALQAVVRDYAFVVPDDVAADALVRAVRGADKAVIAAVRVFDLFRGGGVDDGRKSVGIEVTMQPGERSFTDDDLKAAREKVIAAAQKLGASLRG